LGADARASNVAGAFSATRALDGRSILLVDDVATTGATLIECAKACRAAGAGSVRALVFARDVFD
jgi:predicted amidophosphoribosyltransferase